MKTGPVRGFNLFDGMVLIAATAVGIAWTAETVKDIVVFRSAPHHLSDLVDCLMQGLGLGLPLLLTWTVAILALRFRRPRPRRRLLWRQPGLMACVIVMISAAFCGVLAVVYVVLDGMQHDNGTTLRAHVQAASDLTLMLLLVSPVMQGGVLCAWIALALTGRWRAERSWIDRAGRLLGVLWIVGLPLTILYWLQQGFF